MYAESSTSTGRGYDKTTISKDAPSGNGSREEGRSVYGRIAQSESITVQGDVERVLFDNDGKVGCR